MGEGIRDEKGFLIYDPPLKFDVFGNGGIETGGKRVARFTENLEELIFATFGDS